MNRYQQLEAHGLFDARVPRYTSYPAANHFRPQDGETHQADWLRAVPDGAAVSLYIHIPFCKRLCWFCACRTQGTPSIRPLETYLETLLLELDRLSGHLPDSTVLSRLHLGGGTPTILPGPLMGRLLDAVFDHFDRAADFEFSVEIDPTDAEPDVLRVLAGFGLNRASIGVQDFDPMVQGAIGRQQSYAQTHAVIDTLRSWGVASLNMDLLYGLPHQTGASLTDTLQKVMALQPDRLALYGYAHVPWMSKRQVMIDDSRLPSARARFALSELARIQLVADGYRPVGIDHFARPHDGLARAQAAGHLRRNFQGYTDDTAEVLIGVGASAISRFPQGYAQNASATSLYQGKVRRGGLAGQRGYVMRGEDHLTACMIERLMCDFSLDVQALRDGFPGQASQVAPRLAALCGRFPQACDFDGQVLRLHPDAQPLVRIIAAALDGFAAESTAHSAAI